jgi:hypothetical protein
MGSSQVGLVCQSEGCTLPAKQRGRCATHSQAQWRAENPFKSLRQQIAKYGVTILWYLKRLKKQRGACAICGQPETSTHNGKIKRLAVDHSHDTNEARGLLCYRCNVNLAVIEDLVWVAKARAYLSEPKDDLSTVKLTDEEYRVAGL